MNIKSLLLGSAAALVAVSGARAADAVVIAEPEPMEYVRVCDVYGTGFFYIPGTETCLRIGGYMRYDIGVGDLTNYGWGVDTDGNDEGDTYRKRARFQLRVDARSETELGTLRAYGAFNFQASRTSAAGISEAVDINHAYIELGGFRAGVTDSMFSTFTGYAGGVIADDLGVPYGPFGTEQIAYTFTGGNGFSAAIALETGDSSYDPTLDIDGNLENGGSPIDDYVPHVVAGVSYTQGWGGISVVGGYDSVLEEGAVKGRLDVNATEQLSLFVMAGWSSNDPEFADYDGLGNVTANNYYAQWNGDWAVWGGGSYTVNEKATINAQLAYDEDENFAASLNVAYELVPGLVITPEVEYFDNFEIDDDDFEGEGDGFGAFLRFQRNF